MCCINMDTSIYKFVTPLMLLFYCLSSEVAGTEICDGLVADFLDFRDKALVLTSLCSVLEHNYNEELADLYFGFPVTSEAHWRSLLCAMADADDFLDVLEALRAAREDDDTTGIYTAYVLQDSLSRTRDSGPAILSWLDNYQEQLQPWLLKTNFPNTWPVPDTSRKETARLMAAGEEMAFNMLTYDGYHEEGSDYSYYARALLRSKSLSEYLAVVNRDLVWDTALLECYSATQDVLRDEQRFAILPAAARALFRVLERLHDMGVLALYADYIDFY